MWSDRSPLGWDEKDTEPTAQGRGGAAQRLLPGHHRRDRARRRRLPRHGRLRPLAASGSVPAVTSALVELRVLEGPNLYFPRAAIKLTLDLTQLIDAPERGGAAVRLPDRAAQGPARGAGQRLPAAVRGPGDRAAGAPDRGGGRHHPARACGSGRPTTCTRSWWPTRGATGPAPRRSAGPSPRCSTRCPARTSRSWSATPPSRCAPSEPGPGPTTLRPRVPIVAVTGTNGKTTTSRMVAHIARTHGLHVGWSSTDGIYVDGELVEPGDYSGPVGRRPGAGPQAGAARGHRDRPRRHPAQGHRPGPQRRLGVHQRLRRPPRPARHRHPRPARRGQGRRPADHQAATAGRCSTPTTRGSTRRARRSRPSRGCSPATPTRRRSARRCPTAAGRPPSSTAGSRCSTPTATPTRWSRSSTSR